MAIRYGPDWVEKTLPAGLFQNEVFYYRTFPWATPELLWVDEARLALGIRRGEVLRNCESPPLLQLAQLLVRLSGLGIHHRDVHIDNVVVIAGEPRLIDWQTAIATSPEAPSYDLYGPSPEVPPATECPYWWDSPDPWSIGKFFNSALDRYGEGPFLGLFARPSAD
ncbi:kinase [Mycobacterium phage Omega]|uniref:Protein kinase domain-containing protein n=1 Tax=Mycobacterium phage Omega TaxID=2907835 RepID=Q854R2_BPMOM|nr:kinase [Mycobacterium phage Omega]AAN12646.1 hypothetical protein PBI_OMEGA_2 [Mycobacterium phage Omega]